MNSTITNYTSDNPYKILLLTNRDSDNLGDQVIEACDIALISAVMKNLGFDENQFKIISRAASIISQKYAATQDPALLKTATRLIKKSDLVVFGGAPVFNYAYQPFYERTAVTLEIAKKFNKPVLFSAIGVEGYNQNSKKCQRLKKTLNFDIVKQITTRDDFESLKQYKDSDHITIDKVSDPAVFTSAVFKDFTVSANAKKTIGIFILRSYGFVDNGFDFTREEAAQLWLDLIRDLEKKGYDYELITSGHFGDEAFLDYLIRHYNVPSKKCVFNMNTPEKLIQKISSYAGVVSTRLHPNIISFSLNVPSIGVIWNNKVKEFYTSIGYPERIVEVDNISSAKIIETLESAMQEGIQKDEAYLLSVYNTLFEGIKGIIFGAETDTAAYTYEELLQNIPGYEGTTPEELEKKLSRKFRRTYKTYNQHCEPKNSFFSKLKQFLKRIRNHLMK